MNPLFERASFSSVYASLFLEVGGWKRKKSKRSLAECRMQKLTHLVHFAGYKKHRTVVPAILTVAADISVDRQSRLCC